MSYRIELERAAERDLAHLPRDIQERFIEAIRALGDNPHGGDTKPLKGELAGLRRLRVGDWRAAYQVDQQERTVAVILIAHRREVYERLLRSRG